MMRRTIHQFFGIVVVGLLLTVCLSTDAHATDVDWSLPGLTVTPLPDKPAPDSPPVNNSCQNEDFFVGNSIVKETGCVYAGDGFDYAFVDRKTLSRWGGWSMYQIFVIRFGSETRMHVVNGLFSINQPSYIVPVPHSKHIVFNIPNMNTWGWSTYIIKDLPTHLERAIAGDLSVEYWVKSNSREPLIKNDADFLKKAQRLTVAQDGRWGVIEIPSLGLVRIDFNDLSFRWYSRYEPAGSELLGMGTHFAITNDGRHIVATGKGGQTRVAEVDDNCGQYIQSTFPITPVLPASFCPEHTLDADITAILQDAVDTVDYMTFSYDGGELELFASPRWQYGKEYKPAWIRFSPQGYNADKIAYLALGDSYSSGEGDVDKDSSGRNHYLPHTDEGSDNCHVSSRSYPFLLRDVWRIPLNRMKSVACSGARVVFDYYRGLSGYLGQGNRLYGRPDVGRQQDGALTTFMQGYVPQLEFIKKYQPDIITLTGGGNDVGFADMLSYCAYGSGDVDTKWKLIKEGFFGLFTCDYAKPNSPTQQLILKSIEDQYGYTVTLLKKIKQASPNSRVYVIGYPSFIADGEAICTNSLELDRDERTTIQYFLRLLNNNLKTAAQDQSVQYIDIEDSLTGGRLCEGSEYMTGVWDVNMKTSEKNNIFHPNARGHEKMAAAITSQVNGGSVVHERPNKPSSIGQLMYQGVALPLEVAAKDISANGQLKVSIPPYVFMPGSTIKATLHSEPIELGVLTADSNGGATESLAVNHAPVGYHLLTLEGVSYSGEPMTIYQSLTVGLSDDTSMQEAGNSKAEDNVIANLKMSQPHGIESHNSSTYGQTPKASLLGLVTNTKEFATVPWVHDDMHERHDEDGNIWEGLFILGAASLSLGVSIGINKWKRKLHNR